MSILQALASHYDRLVRSGEAAEYGYSRESISYAIVLSADGTLVDVMDLRDTTGRSPRPVLHSVPRPVPRTSAIASNFLWDKTAYSLGIKLDRENHQPIDAPRERAAFKALHQSILEDTVDNGMRALLSFLDKWRVEDYTCLQYGEDLLDSNVVFRLDGEQQYLHQRPAAQDTWRRYMAGQGGMVGLCLVSGVRGPIERLHPKIKRVRGAQSSGASIVSFNLDAFKSFGHTQGENAPISSRAVSAYTGTLNALLERGSRRRIQIADTTTVFWAEAANSDTASAAAEDLFSALMDPPTDAGEAAKVSDTLAAVAQGQPLPDVAPEVDERTTFYVLGLAPNAARLSVRFWFEGTIGTIARRIGEHWRDLRIDPVPWTTQPAAWRLLYETAAQHKSENIPPTLGGALMRAILTGNRYPRALLAAIIVRIRADGNLSGTRAAIAKAVVRRNERLSNYENNEEDRLVSLDTKSSDTAYNLGRLFAAYAYAETSVANRNATIRDKYMGAASATPRRVFPVLMRGYEHNRSTLAKAADGNKRGAGVRADQAVGNIIELLPGYEKLPATLPLEDQARFFVGYYHQESAFYRRSQSAEDTARNDHESEELK